ncbi:hypothetical protein B0H11DRAFT_2236364 [Mycena galericulata]|nr:hypothetical protein B0H11DRAFT_2236364 [Mycena galericulata]
MLDEALRWQHKRRRASVRDAQGTSSARTMSLSLAPLPTGAHAKWDTHVLIPHLEAHGRIISRPLTVPSPSVGDAPPHLVHAPGARHRPATRTHAASAHHHDRIEFFATATTVSPTCLTSDHLVEVYPRICGVLAPSLPAALPTPPRTPPSNPNRTAHALALKDIDVDMQLAARITRARPLLAGAYRARKDTPPLLRTNIVAYASYAPAPAH